MRQAGRVNQTDSVNMRSHLDFQLCVHMEAELARRGGMSA